MNLFRAVQELVELRPSIRSQSPGSWAGSADDAQRPWSNARNEIVLPADFLSYLQFAPVVSSPRWIWPPAWSVRFLYGKGLPIATAPPGAQPDGTLLFASRLLISPAVGVRREIKSKAWPVGCELAAYGVSAVIVHNDLFFLQDKCFWHNKGDSPFSSHIGGSSNWYMMSDKSMSISTSQTNLYST